MLPPEHPIWHAEETVPAEQQRTLLGIDYGCRTSVVYCPPPKPGDPPNGLVVSLGAFVGARAAILATVTAQIAAANSIGINVLAYATNRELKTQGAKLQAESRKVAQDNFARGKLYIAKLRHPGGCDTAPAALPHLFEAADRELKIRMSTEQRLIDITDPSLFKYHLVFMHGRRSFRFTPRRTRAIAQVHRSRRHADGRLDLRQSGIHRRPSAARCKPFSPTIPT